MHEADRDRIRRYYASGAEQQRLTSQDGWFEHDRTLAVVNRFSQPGHHLLDAGGGGGVYTLALAELGYIVSLIDLSPELVDVARQQVVALPASVRTRVHSAEVLDFLELDERVQYDGVLCLGPGYHAGSEEEMRAILRKCVAVAKPGGVIYLAFIPRLTGVAGLVARAASSPEQVPPGVLTSVFEGGRFANAADGAFCEAWFAEPPQVDAGFAALGVERLTLRSIRGFAAYYGAELAALRDHHPDRFAEVVALTERTAERPEVVATCWHALYVGRRPVRKGRRA